MMGTSDRFLSAFVNPSRGAIAYLVLELIDGQWFLYTLGEDRKIIDALPFVSDISAFRHAETAFDVAKADWIETASQ